MIHLRYSDILKKNLELRDSAKGSEFRIAVLSNIICHQINEIVEYSLRANGVNASVTQCNYRKLKKHHNLMP